MSTINENFKTQPRTLVYKRHGIAVKDSYTGLLIIVEPEDIEHAVCKDHQKCVIARALKRSTKATWVDVGAEVVLVGVNDRLAKRYILSRMARKQVAYFDTHKGKFAPCQVQLKRPPRSKRLTAMVESRKRGQRKHDSTRTHLRKRRPTR